jgi:hypothetical protein
MAIGFTDWDGAVMAQQSASTELLAAPVKGAPGVPEMLGEQPMRRPAVAFKRSTTSYPDPRAPREIG